MRKTLVLFLLVLLCSLHGFCQFDAGSILGAVTDGAGNQISGVKITLEDVNRGVTVTTLTGSDGTVQFPSVPISRYHIRTEATGFGVQTSQVFQLTLGARQRVDFQLHVAQVRELPLNGRYYSDLVLLSSGVLRAPSSFGSSSAFREGSFNVNGLRST